MFERILRVLRALDIEEKILHVGILLCIAGLFFPWIGGQRSGMAQELSGFGFYTGYMGHVILLVQLFLLAILFSPLLGGPVVVRRADRHMVRFLLSGLSLVLIVACFTVLFRLTSEVSGAEIRFGVYVSLIGSALTTLYAFLMFQEQRKNEARQLFHHPDLQIPVKTPAASAPFDDDRPPPPPPPPPPPLEDHQITRP